MSGTIRSLTGLTAHFYLMERSPRICNAQSPYTSALRHFFIGSFFFSEAHCPKAFEPSNAAAIIF